MRIKIATYIEVGVSPNESADTQYEAIEKEVLENRANYEFVIEEVNGESDHELVDEVVP